MTENEAINTLQYLLGYENAVDNGELETSNNLNSQEKEALRMILEEIQQYRAIGTVEEFKALKDAEEQGGLLRPKCRIGDVVYALWSIPTESKYVVYPAEVKEINLSSTNARKMIMYKLEPIAFRGRYNKYYDDDFGKLVFMSQEEAEQMKGEQNG